MRYWVLWKERRKTVKSYRPEWESFKRKKDAQRFARLVRKDRLTKDVRLRTKRG